MIVIDCGQLEMGISSCVDLVGQENIWASLDI